MNDTLKHEQSEDLNEKFGQRLYDLIVEKDLKIADVARKAGIKNRQKLSMAVNVYTDPEKTNPRALTPAEIVAVADVLGVSAAYLLLGYNEENATIGKDLGLSNNTIETLTTMKNTMVKQVIDILVADWSILIHLSEYLNSDFNNVQRVYKKGGEVITEWFPVKELSDFDNDDLERVNRLRLLDDLQRIREENKGGKGK